MVTVTPRHVLAPSPQLMVAFTGLEGDVQSLSQELTSQVSSKLGRGLGFMNENISPHTFRKAYFRKVWDENGFPTVKSILLRDESLEDDLKKALATQGQEIIQVLLCGAQETKCLTNGGQKV